ncbi:uncharacterized protein F5891DRAFT_1130931 [Suillus fuscotomentosus]|uniref:CxC2-like cysteine cluster KDZ transposase-associated domain-containing protein n=1 Tax=Suillus fuscotomentosus TaxID=1912939 RepID=A0AAD4DV48_9AGAM|nr:uncharacterized protein F5891DRAFT_1130931 [Suillus fuscotomentosus]KAG1894399.1 hypothetical protein F5891DRAFT_1130931 [Suillus fuscotomentosus]
MTTSLIQLVNPQKRENFLLELLRLDGHGNYIFDQICKGRDGCQEYPDYRCWDCFGTALYCKGCTLVRHQESPLHRLQHWIDEHFENTSLKSLSLRIQLSHHVGEHCYNPVSTAFHNDFVVLDTNGVHSVAVDFCGCETAQSLTTQLLCVQWFPATSLNPKTAGTFRLLYHFHILTFESKALAFECWQTLSRLSDNSGVNHPKDRYEALLQMIKEWWNLTLLKRFGCGHDIGGIDATQPGSCAVLCPACPQPSKNLPQGWEDTTPEKRWLYGIFVAIDANFCLARKNISSYTVDPGLSNGWSYFMEEKRYKTFLNEVSKQPQEKSTCINHNAVNLAEMKNSRGLAATGARTVDSRNESLQRHNFKRPCAVGDLQKGEKYMNMDYLFCSTMQYAKDLLYPNHIHFKCSDKSITFLVPKFHLPAHILACQITYSHNLIRGMGHTEAEAPERGWANINPVATHEMGLGSRCDTLDDHFGDFNWKKLTNLGVSLLRKLKVTIPECDQHHHNFLEFDNTRIEERPEEVSRWKIAIEEWEADMSMTNPFGATTTTMTQASVRLSLSQNEAEDLECGVDHSLHSEISPTVLISMGIGIEEEHPALIYMPLVSRIRTTCNSNSRAFEEKAHEINLLLPSKLKEHTLDAVCNERLCRFEWELHRGQSFNALDDLGHHLLLSNMCASAVIGKVECNVIEAADRYRRVRNTLKNLHETLGEHDWQEQAHVHSMSEGEAGQSEGNRMLSWIWKMHALQIEWCKARAHANCWMEEVQLLLEEMRYVREFLSWHATWWDEQADQRVELPAAEAEGIKGYARWQAVLRRNTWDAFMEMWSGFRHLNEGTINGRKEAYTCHRDHRSGFGLHGDSAEAGPDHRFNFGL